MMAKEKGLYQKYKVTKTNGEPIDEDAQYFVLRMDKDPDAICALKVYAWLIRLENPILYSDLLLRLSFIEETILSSYRIERK